MEMATEWKSATWAPWNSEKNSFKTQGVVAVAQTANQAVAAAEVVVRCHRFLCWQDF